MNTATGQWSVMQTQGSRPVVVTADTANCDYEYIVPCVTMILPESKSCWLTTTTCVHSLSEGTRTKISPLGKCIAKQNILLNLIIFSKCKNSPIISQRTIFR